MIEVPVPPFADFAAAQQFHRLVLLHLRELKLPGEPVGLHQFLLAEARPPGRGGRTTGGCRTSRVTDPTVLRSS